MSGSSSTRLIVVAFFLVVLFCIGFVVRDALLLIFVSVVFAVVFLPCIRWIQKFRLRGWSPGRGPAIVIVLFATLGGVTAFLAFAVPPLAQDVQQLTSDLPHNLASLQQKVRDLPFGHTVAQRLDQDHIRRWVELAIQHSLTVFNRLANGVMALLTIALMTAYFILDGQRAFRWAMSMVPETQRGRLAQTLERSAERMQRWLYGQFILMVILGSSSAAVFGFLGIRYFVALAVFAGVANFIPILGPIAALTASVLIAALDSWEKLLGVVIFYAAYQQVESAYLTPRIMRAQVDLPGVAVIVALTLGAELAGLLGAIAAVPTAALIATMMDEYLVRRPAVRIAPPQAA